MLLLEQIIHGIIYIFTDFFLLEGLRIGIRHNNRPFLYGHLQLS